MIVRYGSEYGGFYYPSNLPKLDVIYCVGAGEDITHDVILSHKTNSIVHIFDPTPRAIEHVKYVKDVLDNKRIPQSDKRFGGGAKDYWDIILSHPIQGDSLVLHEYGLGTDDGDVKFFFPNNKEHVSCSVLPIGRSSEYINVPVKTINTIMNELGHDHIDLLKIDVENIECDVLEKMMDDNICPTYLSVDFDLWNHDRSRCVQVINKLIQYGYRIIKQTGQDFSFFKPRCNVIQHGTDGFGHQFYGLLSLMMMDTYYFDSHSYCNKPFQFEHGTPAHVAGKFLIDGVKASFPYQVQYNYKRIEKVIPDQPDTDTLYALDNAYYEPYRESLKDITKNFMLPRRHHFKTIVLHVRLGDTLYYEERKHKHLKYCEDVEDIVTKLVEGDRSDYKIIVHTDSSDFTLKNHECMYYRKDTPILEVLADFINADVFVCGQSSLSFVSTLYDTHELVLVPDDVKHLIGKDCIRFSDFLANPRGTA